MANHGGELACRTSLLDIRVPPMQIRLAGCIYVCQVTDVLTMFNTLTTSRLAEVVQNYSDANIPLEVLWSDIDYSTVLLRMLIGDICADLWQWI